MAERDMQIAQTIIQQLGGSGRLNAMTGAYNFVAIPNGVSFKIKNQRANYIKITLNGKDLYDLEVGRIRGNTYKVVSESNDLYYDMLKPAIEKATGMYLSLFAQGGTMKNLDKIKNNIGADLYKHIGSLNQTQLEKQLKELRSELSRVSNKKDNRYYKLKDEEFLILHRLERADEFQYAKGGTIKVGDMVRSTVYNGIEGKVVSKRKSEGIQYLFIEGKSKENPYKNAHHHLRMDEVEKMAKGGTIKVGDMVRSTVYNGIEGKVVSKKKSGGVQYLFVLERSYSNPYKNAHHTLRMDEVEKMANGGKLKYNRERYNKLLSSYDMVDGQLEDATTDKERKELKTKLERIASLIHRYERNYAKGGTMKNDKVTLRRGKVIDVEKLSKTKLKSWYRKNFPTDDLGKQIDSKATFLDLWEGIHKPMDIYDVFGVADSIIRERLFSGLAEISNSSYDYIYQKWVEEPMANGGNVGGFKKGDKIYSFTTSYKNGKSKKQKNKGIFIKKLPYDKALVNYDNIGLSEVDIKWLIKDSNYEFGGNTNGFNYSIGGL